MKCKYKPVEIGYVTTCGYALTYFSEKWKYCPFCGNVIEKEPIPDSNVVSITDYKRNIKENKDER